MAGSNIKKKSNFLPTDHLKSKTLFLKVLYKSWQKDQRLKYFDYLRLVKIRAFVIVIVQLPNGRS